jgi:hypothetical protein
VLGWIGTVVLNRRRYWYLGLVLAAALFWQGAAPLDLITLRLPKQDYRLAVAGTLEPSEYVSLNYRHSVELTRVEGRFKLGPGPGLLAWQTRMASVGTGLPNTQAERTHREGDWLVVDEGMKPVGPLRFFLARINQTRLAIGKSRISLDGIKQGQILQINAERISAWRWWLWKLAGLSWPHEGD